MKSKLQQHKSQNIRTNARIMADLRTWRLRVYVAHLIAIALGLTAALLGLVIGPAMQILMVPGLETLPWRDILGPVWSVLLVERLPGSGIGVADIYAYLPWVLLAVASFKSLLTFWQWYTWEWLGEQLAFSWRQELVGSFVQINPSQRDQRGAVTAESELGGLMTQDIRTCRDYVVHFFGGLPREGLQALFMAISIAALSPKLFLVFAVGLAPVVGILGRLGRKIRKRATQALEDNSGLGEWIQQRLLGIETIKQLKMEDHETGAMRVASANLYDRFVRTARVKARTGPLIELLGVIAMAVALSVAFSEISSGKISGAVAMSFFASLALFAQAAAKLGRYFNSNREGLAAASRIFAAIDAFKSLSLPVIRPETCLKKMDPVSIRLRGVCVKYGSIVALDQFSHDFEAGKLYCIVGSSGAGKSSLFGAMLGLREIDSGSIEYLVGQNFDGKTLDMAYMPQSVPTFPGMLAENVAYPSDSYDAERVAEALRIVGFKLDSDRLPDGIKTRVGPGELQLSGGQAQRLQLARLFYHRSPFVLIDEGTSALDPEIESLILGRAKDLAASGSVVLMIAHRPAAVDFSDEMIVMKDGRVVRSGSKADVIRTEEFKAVFR